MDPLTASCVERSQPCATGIEFACDEAADCPPRAKCCAGEREVSCAEECIASPGLPPRQLCKSDRECDGQACRPATIGTAVFWLCAPRQSGTVVREALP